MATNDFKLRLTTTYAGEDNTVAKRALEKLDPEGWRPLEVSGETPGFLVFVYAILECQHMYMRVNCAERGLALESAVGVIDLQTADDWIMTKMIVAYEAKLSSGTPTEDDLSYVVERMKQCPVSKNLNEAPEAKTTLTLS